MKRGKPRYDHGDDHDMRALWDQGVAAKMIAELLGRSEHAVKQRASELGLMRRVRHEKVRNLSITFTESEWQRLHRRRIDTGVPFARWARRVILVALDADNLE